jgi:uncharacterized tellurite resistance protein B-like protein
MGIDDDVLDTEIDSETTLSPEEAVAAIIFVAMSADGEVIEEEIEILKDMLSTMELFEDYSPNELQGMLDAITDIYDQEGIDTLFNIAVESISEDLAETAFEAVVKVVLIEGEIPEAEEDFIDDLQQALGIEDKVAQEIIDELTAAEEI